jgi:hypothetical protein
MTTLADAWRHAARPLTPPAEPAHGVIPRGWPIGPHTRVVLTGTAPPATVRLALTRAWRAAGQPLTVVVAGPLHGGVIDRAARAWVDEHACAGHEVVTRWTTLASSPGVVLDLDGVAR